MFKHLSPQPTMREFLSSCISMRNSRLLVLLISLLSVWQGLFAENQPYAYLNNGKLILRYDDNWNDVNNPYVWEENEQAFLGEIFGNNVTQVIFEPSFSECRPTTTEHWFSGMTNLESITGLEYLNTEAVTAMHFMFNGCSKLTSLDLTNFNIEKVSLMQSMFEGCSSLEMIYAGNWDIEREGYFDSFGMFAGCENLPNWNENNSNDINFAKPIEDGGYFTPKQAYAVVKDANLTFYYDGYKFEDTYSIDQNSDGTWRTAAFTTVTFDASFAAYKLSSTAGMFSGLTGLTKIYDLDNLNTSSITDMRNMFNGCSGLTTIYCGKDWSGLDVPSTGMFAGCTNLVGAIPYDNNKTDITFANPYDGYFFQLPKAYAVLDANGLLKFYYDTNKPDESESVTVYDIPWNTGDPDDWNEPEWVNYEDYDENGVLIGNTAITSVAFDASFSDYSLESAFDMFATCTALESIDFTNFNTSNVKNMSGMFFNCSSLTALELSGFDTQNVEDMSYMFSKCYALTSLDLRNFNTGNVTNMEGMFFYEWFEEPGPISHLKSLYLSSFNTSKVENMSYMFCGCSALTAIDLSNFNTENVRNMFDMFEDCASLQTLDLSSFDTRKVSDMSWMFYGCSSLTSLDLSNFNTENVRNMFDMFEECTRLQTLNLSNFNTANVIDMKWMFTGCESLRNIYCNDDWSSIPRSEEFSSDWMFLGCTSLPNYQDDKDNITYAKPVSMGGYFTSSGPIAYAVLTSDGNLSFYYDENSAERANDQNTEKIFYDFQWNIEDEDEYYYEYITTATFDASYRDYPITSTASMFNGLYYLTTINGLENLNTSNVTDMSYMFNLCRSLKTLDLTGFNTENVSNMEYMFADCETLTNIYCNDNWDQPNILQSDKMFYSCFALPNYDSEHFDVSSAKPTSEGGYFTKREAYAIVADGNLTFFYDANKPASGSLEFTNTGEGSWRSATFTSVTFDASMKNYKFISTAGMFSSMTNLTVINDLTNLNTSAITDMSDMFNGCSSLASIYCNNDWSSLTIPSDNMFLGCTQLDGYNASNVTIAFAKPTEGGYFTTHNLAYAVLSDGTLTFYYDAYKETRQGTVYDIPWVGDLPGWLYPEEVIVDPFSAPARKAKTRNLNISYAVFDESFGNYHGLTSTKGMFAGLEYLTAISGIEYLNTENVTDMSSMFQQCYQLEILDFSNFNTENVTDMSYMFYGYSGSGSLDLSDFNTENVTNMSYMFYETSLSRLDLSSFDTGNVTNMSGMFHSGYNIENLDLSNFNTENVADMSYMFTGCSELTSLDLSNFNTENVTNMSYMFSSCSKLTSLDLSNFNTENVTDMSFMFHICQSLINLDLTSFTVSSDNNLTLQFMFGYCYNLETIFCNSDFNNGHVVPNYSISLFIGCTNLKGAVDFNSSNTNYDFANPTTGYFTYGLRDNADNSSLIDDTESMPRVGLVGRTLYKDGDWNTLCLPFSVGDEYNGLTGTPLEGATVMTLDNSADSQTGFDLSSGTLPLNFVEVKSIEAGKPYIIKWNSGEENIVNPTFTNVTLSSTPSPVVAPSVSFIGTYNPQPFTSANSDILYLGAGNTLYYPSSDMTINAFRAYFELNLTSSQQVKSFVLNFGDEEAASIKTISESSDHSKSSDPYFSLDGRRLLSQPITPGLYIHNGRKVMIK